MNTEVLITIAPMVGQPCTRKKVGRLRSLSLGFGESKASADPEPENSYREWELGTYYCPWRVVRRGSILCGSQDSGSIDMLNASINQIEFGRFVSLRQTTDFDIRVDFDNELSAEILASTSNDDESFHIFCPGEICVEFSVAHGWRIGKSDEPWN